MVDNCSIPVPLDPLKEDTVDRRLWIGNLDPRITEFVLVKLLQKYGSIEKFDLLFHRSGPLEGQPRGYAFVTYKNSENAKAAQENLNGRLVGNKTLSVKWAHNVGKDNFLTKPKFVPHIPALTGAKSEVKLSKSNIIQAIEAKLKKMEAADTSLDFEISNKPSTSTASSVQYLVSKQRSNENKMLRHKPYFKSK